MIPPIHARMVGSHSFYYSYHFVSVLNSIEVVTLDNFNTKITKHFALILLNWPMPSFSNRRLVKIDE